MCARVICRVGTIPQRLKDQQAKGSKFLLGDSLTALDVYWATFAALIAPLPPDKCPMMEGLRKVFEASDPEIAKVVDPALVAHRDFIYNEYLVLPIRQRTFTIQSLRRQDMEPQAISADFPYALLLTCTPGALITAEMVAWCQQNLKNLKVVDIGPEIHFVQEDNPHLIGKELAEWYASL